MGRANFQVKVASHPKCHHFGKKKFYDSKIDLTLIFVFWKTFRKNIISTRSYRQNSVFFTICILRNVDKLLWQCVNTSLSCYIPSLFRHAISRRPDNIFALLPCHPEKGESDQAVLDIGKKKTRKLFDKDWADKLAAGDKGSYYKQHEFEFGGGSDGLFRPSEALPKTMVTMQGSDNEKR